MDKQEGSIHTDGRGPFSSLDAQSQPGLAATIMGMPGVQHTTKEVATQVVRGNSPLAVEAEDFKVSLDDDDLENNPLAKQALDTFRLGQDLPAANQTDALVNVIRSQKPALPIVGNQIYTEDYPSLDSGVRDFLGSTTSGIVRTLPAIAALILRGSTADRDRLIGTCFLIDDVRKLVLTCLHVLEDSSVETNDIKNGWLEVCPGNMPLQGAPPRVAVKSRVASDADLVVLELDDVLPGAGALPVLSGPPPIDSDRRLCIIGYPADPADFPAILVPKIFDKPPGILTKRCSPGFARETLGDGRLTHDCTTLDGSSGSPVLDRQGRVIAVHEMGDFGQHATAIMTQAACGSAELGLYFRNRVP